MSRFTNDQKLSIKDNVYTLPRLVTMVTKFAPVQEVDLYPMTVIEPVKGADYTSHDRIKWVKVKAVRKKNDAVEGWIPKSILHDFAYAKLARKGELTGASYGGDKVDYDTNRSNFLLVKQDDELKSRCEVCGKSLNKHKMYEDEDILKAMSLLFEILSENHKKEGVWHPKEGHTGKVMVGICRLEGNRYRAAYSGHDTSGADRFSNAVDRLAVKLGQKGKWATAGRIPAGTDKMRTRSGQYFLTVDLVEVFQAANIATPPADLSAMHCAAPKLLYSAYNSGNNISQVEAFGEWWYDPENAKNYENSTGKIERRHQQTVPSCTRCSVAVRLLNCPE